MNDRHVRAYRALLRVYPRRFHADYRDELTRLFADQLRDARASGGTWGVSELWVRSLVDLLRTAPRQHVEREVLVASPASGAAADPPTIERDPSRTTFIAIAWAPLWLAVVLVVFAPAYVEPALENPPGILGMPAGVVLVLLALAWTSVGVLIGAATRSPIARTFALVLFTIPATMVVLLAPPIVLMVQSLAV